MSGRPDLTASARENVDFPDPAIPVTTMRRCASWGYMTPSQGRSGARFDYMWAVCAVVSKLANDLLRHGRIKDVRRSWQRSHDCHARQLATGKAPRDQEAPGSIALLHTCAARDDTSVPTVSARAPPAGQVAMHPTPDAIRHEQPLQRKFKERARKRQPSIQNDSNRSRGICQSCAAPTSAHTAESYGSQGRALRVP